MSRAEPDMFTTPDHTGYIPDRRLLNTFWKNTKTDNIYQVISYIFDADEDRWKIVYIRHEGTGQEYSRLPERFFGNNSKGHPRFERAIPSFYTQSDMEDNSEFIEERHE